MAINKIAELIEQLKQSENRPEQADGLIALLEEAQTKLGDDATEEQIEQAIQNCFIEHLSGLHEVNNSEDPETQEYMHKATSTITSFFEEEGWRYSERINRPDLVVYEMGFHLQNCNLQIRVHIEAEPRVCRIDAILPIAADALYDFLLCKAIAKENYPRRFGALQYDERDGEVSYRYSFPIGHGVYKDEFKSVFLAVAGSASDSFDVVKKHCFGKYKTKEKNEILEKIVPLVRDLSDDE